MGTHAIFESDFDCLTDRMDVTVRKFLNDISLGYKRTRQRAIETFGENVERTHYDPDIDASWAKLQCAQRQIKEIKSHLEMLIQPNPALRIEKAIVTTLRPENVMLDTDFLDGSSERDFANCLASAGVELEPISSIGRTLQAVADIHNEVARGEKQFRQTTSALILTQLNEFLTLADDVFRERRH